MSDVVLVHGTTQGPAGFERLAAALRARGHRAWPVDLAGDPERDEAAYGKAALAQLPPGLEVAAAVAHSGSGLVLPAIARAVGAHRQIWLAAYVPDGRRSLANEAAEAGEGLFAPEWMGEDPTADPVAAAYFLFHDCPLETVRWALATLRRFVSARLYRSVVAPETAIPSTYIAASLDRTVRPTWQRREPGWRVGAQVVEVEAGHCPHVSRPEVTATLIARAIEARR